MEVAARRTYPAPVADVWAAWTAGLDQCLDKLADVLSRTGANDQG
jgi:hypothetical protein